MNGSLVDPVIGGTFFFAHVLHRLTLPYFMVLDSFVIFFLVQTQASNSNREGNTEKQISDNLRSGRLQIWPFFGFSFLQKVLQALPMAYLPLSIPAQRSKL